MPGRGDRVLGVVDLDQLWRLVDGPQARVDAERPELPGKRGVLARRQILVAKEQQVVLGQQVAQPPDHWFVDIAHVDAGHLGTERA